MTSAKELPPPPSFTRHDSADAQLYLQQRALLRQMWDLAVLYPNVASRINVRIRKADPMRDYRYDESVFGDAAIIVDLSWFDTAEACKFLSCNATYPRNGTCRPGDEPRIFPSGDSTTVTACEPACFMIAETRTAANGRIRKSVADRYKSTVGKVMSAHTGAYRPYDSLTESYVAKTTTNSSEDVRGHGRSVVAPDIPQLEYSKSSGLCELANVGLLSYVTKPFERAVQDGGAKNSETCRLTNFLIGDDLATVKAAMDDVEGGTVVATTGRHSRTYCSAFDKQFDDVSRTCYESWWEQFLSYTFIGSALIRLVRHAIAGGDRCDTLLPTDPARKETHAGAVQRFTRSRKHWFEDVDKQWRLPPPNILLSDLGVTELGQVWSNRHGGTIEVVEPKDKYVRTVRSTLNSEKVGDENSGNDGSETIDDMNFDAEYAEIIKGRGVTGDDKMRELMRSIGVVTGHVALQLTVESMVRQILRKSFNRTLRFVGRNMTGRASRLLVGMGLRVTTARLVSTVFARFSTRMLLALGTTSSGVGTVIGIIEMLGVLLDFMFMFGWDPGNYNSEFTNDTFDDLATGWLRQKRFYDIAAVDPSLLLVMFRRDDSTATADGVAPSDDSMFEPSVADDAPNTSVRSMDLVPWFFEGFDAAVNAIVEDSTGAPRKESPDDYRRLENRRVRPIRLTVPTAHGGEEDVLARVRPLTTENDVTNNMLLTMHYFAHRKTNSLGQRVSSNGSSVRLNDDFVSSAVRDNELAALLSSSYAKRDIPRDALLGLARRNVAGTILTMGSCVSTVALAGVGLAITAVFGSTISSLVANDRWNMTAAVLLVALLIAAPIVCAVLIGETIFRDAAYRSFERRDIARDRDSVSENEVDYIDKACDAVTEHLREIVNSSERTPVIARSLLTRLHDELRIIYNA